MLAGAAVVAPGAAVLAAAAVVAADPDVAPAGAEADVEDFVVADVAGFGWAEAASGASSMAPIRRRGTQRCDKRDFDKRDFDEGGGTVGTVRNISEAPFRNQHEATAAEQRH